MLKFKFPLLGVLHLRYEAFSRPLIVKLRNYLYPPVQTTEPSAEVTIVHPEPVLSDITDGGKIIVSVRSHAHKTIKHFKGPTDVVTYSGMVTIATREIIARINSNSYSTTDQAILEFNNLIDSMLAEYKQSSETKPHLSNTAG